MARSNLKVKTPALRTHEGAVAVRINPELQLRRLVLAHMLFEDQFYIDGKEQSAYIAEAVKEVAPRRIAEIAVEARQKQKLRHMPLFLTRELARRRLNDSTVSDTLAKVIQRADELSEFLAIYWKDNKDAPLAAQVKKGLARAFTKFSAYDLAKYNQDGAVKLRDVLFLCHAQPKDAEQAEVWKKLVEGTLAPASTWEVALSAGDGKKTEAQKKEVWEGLLKERKLGALALLRNLRNMNEAGVDQNLVKEALRTINVERVLPFRFVAAAQHNPKLEPELESAMLKCVEAQEKLPGRTAIVVDNSGSMYHPISQKSEMQRIDAACALAILIREITEDAVVIGYGTEAKLIPARRGFALRDAIKGGPGGGTNTETAIQLAKRQGYERIIVVTDEQSHQTISGPDDGIGYVINVGGHRHGIGYGQWTHIDGWSEAIIEFIRQAEQLTPELE